MATHRIPARFTLPGPNVYPEPAALNLQANDRYPQDVWVFPDSATRDGLGFAFVVPVNYVGSAVFKALYATTATSGNLRLELDYTAVADGETADPSTDQESIGANTTVPGTARLLDWASLTPTSGNFAAGDLVQGTVFRDGTATAGDADTVAASVYIFGLVFEFADV